MTFDGRAWLVIAACYVGCASSSDPGPDAASADGAKVTDDVPPRRFTDALLDNARSRWARLGPEERAAWLDAVVRRGALEPRSPSDSRGGILFEVEAGDQARAREALLDQVLQAAVSDLSLAALSTTNQALVRDELAAMIVGESFERGRLSARVDVDEAQRRVLDRLGVARTLGQEEFVLLVRPTGWFEGDGLRREERTTIGEVLAAGCSDTLLRFRMRKAPAGSDRARVEKAAITLGVSPSEAQLQSFGDMFKADLVITIHGSIRFEPFPPGARESATHFGYLRCEGVRALVYSRKVDGLLAEFTLGSDEALRQRPVRSALTLHCPWVSRDRGLAEQVEAYARDVGDIVARNVARRLIQSLHSR